MMHAMQLDAPRLPLRLVERPLPTPGQGQLRVAVSACGVCRTDLHVADGDIVGTLPIVPGHEIVGRVDALASDVAGFEVGQRVGVPWLGHTCGSCTDCRSAREDHYGLPTSLNRGGQVLRHTFRGRIGQRLDVREHRDPGPYAPPVAHSANASTGPPSAGPPGIRGAPLAPITTRTR